MSDDEKPRRDPDKPQPINDPRDRREARLTLARLEDEVAPLRAKLLRALGPLTGQDAPDRIFRQGARTRLVGDLQDRIFNLRARLEAS